MTKYRKRRERSKAPLREGEEKQKRAEKIFVKS